MKTIGHYINGETVAGASGGLLAVANPATGEQIAQVACASMAEVDTAVAAARDAFRSWSHSSLSLRTAILHRYRALLVENHAAIAEIVSEQHGKVRADAHAEVGRGIDVVEHALGLAHHLKGTMSEEIATGTDAYNTRHAVGVCAGITPFNFPVMVPMWMFPVAIACGNTFVLKPSEKNPSGITRIAELFTEAGLPEGVLNVVQGDASVASAILEHPGVDAVSFVGSTPIARHVYATAAGAGKRVQALGGAKNHMIVANDADVTRAAAGAIAGGYGSAGERCMAVSVIVAIGDVADRLVAEIERQLVDFKVGPGLGDEAMDMGALITREHRDRVKGYVDGAESEGGTIVIDGRGLSVDGHENGFFLGPCLIDDVRPDMTVYTDEVFGPVLSLIRVETLAEAIALINDCPFGNGAVLYSDSGSTARAFVRQASAGMLGVNIPVPAPTANFSFGGWDQSLFGPLHCYGEDGFRFYTKTKAVMTNW